MAHRKGEDDVSRVRFAIALIVIFFSLLVSGLLFAMLKYSDVVSEDGFSIGQMAAQASITCYSSKCKAGEGGTTCQDNNITCTCSGGQTPECYDANPPITCDDGQCGNQQKCRCTGSYAQSSYYSQSTYYSQSSYGGGGGQTCNQMGGDYCSSSGSCPYGKYSLGKSSDCNPCCKSGNQPPPPPPPNSAPLVGLKVLNPYYSCSGRRLGNVNCGVDKDYVLSYNIGYTFEWSSNGTYCTTSNGAGGWAGRTVSPNGKTSIAVPDFAPKNVTFTITCFKGNLNQYRTIHNMKVVYVIVVPGQ